MKRMSYILMLFAMIAMTQSIDAQVTRVNVRTHPMPSAQSCEVIYEADFVDVQPQFPGGERELCNFINSTRKYPYEAYKNRISGRVVCSFVVNANGTISHLCVIKGCNEHLNEEALRIIRAMPQWVAGKIDNKNVAVRYILPIVFRL